MDKSITIVSNRSKIANVCNLTQNLKQPQTAKN